MKRKLALLVAIVMILTSINLVPLTSFAATTSVNPGVGTLAAAVNSAYGGDTLTLGDGVYYVPSTITVGKNLTITATDGTNPIVVGGQQATGWENYSGNIYRKAYTGSVTSIIEGTKAGKIAISGLFTADSASGNTINSGSIPSGLKTGYAKVISYGSKDANWQSTVNTITSNSSGSLTFSFGTKWGVSSGTKFEIINDITYLDEAGEFAYDGQYVYYYPYDAAKLETEVSIATTSTIFDVNGNSTLTLRGLDIAGTNGASFYNNGDYNATAAVNVSGAAVIDGCDFYGIGSNAVTYHGSASDLTVQNSTFTGIGGTAVYLYGHGATVTNNTMTNIGTEYTGGAVSIDGNNNKVSHNDISWCTRWGINMCGADSSNGYGNILEYNDISHCNTKTSDSGLIYLYRMDGTTSTRRNTIRYNAVHDSVCYSEKGFGIYLDDDANYTDVYGNWVYNLSSDAASHGYLMAPIMIKGVGSEIHDNVIANNRIDPNLYGSYYGNNNAVFVAQQLNNGYNTSANKVYRNIVSNNDDAGSTCLFRVMDDTSNAETFAEVDYNVYAEAIGSYTMSALGGAYDVGEWRRQGFDTNSLYSTDPDFQDAANGNFAVTAAIPETHYQNPLTVDMIGVNGADVDLLTPPPVTEVPPEQPGTGYIVDTTASSVQNAFDYQHTNNGTVAPTSTGYTFSAVSSDFDSRVWVNGCPIGNAANGDGVTVSFNAVLPATNAGRVYYGYSGAQNVEGQNPFFGFKPVNGGYRLLSNLSYQDATDEYYNETIYSGTVPVIVYITANQFELYVKGEKVAVVPVTDTQLGSRWYYAFFSYYAGGTNTSFEVTDLKYLAGKAIVSTALVTDAPINPINNYPVAGDQKWVQDGNTYIQDGYMYIWSDGAKALLTSGESAMISFDIASGSVNMQAMQQGGAKEDIVTFKGTGEAIVLFVPNGDTSDYYAYLDGVLVDNGSLTTANADVWNYNTYNAANFSNAKISAVASWLPVNEAPTLEPGVTEPPIGVELFAEYDLSNPYVNGPNGTNSYADGILTMTKDKEGSNYNNIIWSDSSDTKTGTMTLMFDAKVSGYFGYINTWDGYAISLRAKGGADIELVRIVPTETGTAITRGVGAEVIATLDTQDYVAYSCQYNKEDDTITVYANGTKVIDNVAIGWNGATQHGFLIKNGMSTANGAVLKIADMELWTGATVRTAPGTYVEVTEEPTAPPTPVPDGYYDGKVPVAGTAVDTNMYTNNKATGQNGSATGDYVIDANPEGYDTEGNPINTGDASLYLWSDNQVGKLNQGKEVMLSFTINVPEDNAVMSAEHGVQIAYMDKSSNATAIYTFSEGGTFDCKLGLLPDGQYYFSVDDVQVAKGTFACDYANLWNICWRTYHAGGSNTKATISNIASAEIAEWVVAEVQPDEPTDEPGETEPPIVEGLLMELDLSNPYGNGPDGTNSYADGVLTMTKDKEGSNYNNILWSNSVDSKTETMTLMFDAKVSGYFGYVNTWDGYAISLRHDKGAGDTELIRIVPTETGTAITRGAGSEVIATLDTQDYVAYSCQYNKADDTITVYANGTKVIDNVALGLNGVAQEGFMIKNGMGAANGAVLKIADMEVWNGETVRTEPGTYVDPTPAPVDYTQNYPVAGEQKWVQDENTYVQDGYMYIWSDGTKALLTAGEPAMISFDIASGSVNMQAMQQGGAKEDIVTFKGTGEAIVLFVPNGDTSDYYAYLDGVLVDNGSLTTANADVWNYNTYNAANFSNAKISAVASWLPVNEAPTLEPGETEPPIGVELFHEYNLSGYYADGPNGTVEYVEDFELLSLKKDVAGSNFKTIIWSDSADTITDDTMTLVFDAKVGGYYGYVNNYDGYAISLRHTKGMDDTELVRICPDENGVAITKGAGGTILANIEGTGFHAYSCQYNKATDILSIYVDGVLVAEDIALGWNGATQHGILIKSGHNDATGVTMQIADVEHWTGEYVRETASTVGPTEAPTDAPTEPPVYTTPDPSLNYVLDTEAAVAMEHGTSTYNQGGSIVETADGYELDTLSTSDFSARVWVNGASLGNAVKAGGLTVSFTAELPATNGARVYYAFAGKQDVTELNPFVGFKYNADENGYRLLSNKSHEDATDEYYNETVYTGEVDIMLYIMADKFEVYADGQYLATVYMDAEATGLGSRWYYAFESYWGGEFDTKMTIKNLQYLAGDAVIAEELESGYTVSGSVALSDADADAQIKVTLKQGDAEVGYTFTEADGSYSLEGVEPGTYNLVIERAGHKTVSVNITVEEEDLSVAEIFMFAGDVNADGVIDVGDLSDVVSYLGQQLANADLNVDGVVDVADWSIVLNNLGN